MLTRALSSGTCVAELTLNPGKKSAVSRRAVGCPTTRLRE